MMDSADPPLESVLARLKIAPDPEEVCRLAEQLERTVFDAQFREALGGRAKPPLA